MTKFRRAFSPEFKVEAVRQLATSYTCSGYFSLSYTFGSLFNNVVNPRMGSGGGGSCC